MSTIYERVIACLKVATAPVPPDDLVEAVYGRGKPGNTLASIRASISKGNMGSRGKRVGYYANGYVLNSRLSTFIAADRLPTIVVPQVGEDGRPVPMQVKVLAALEQAPRPLTADEVAEVVYRGHPDGGPLYARENISQVVMDLRRSGTSVESAKGRRGGYYLDKSSAKVVPKRWTCAEQIRLREMVASGMTIAEVASSLGRSVSSVESRRKRLHIRLPVLPMRGVCEGAVPRSGQVVDVLRSAGGPVAALDLVAAVYGGVTAGSRKTLRVLVHNLRRRGVPVAIVGGAYALAVAA